MKRMFLLMCSIACIVSATNGQVVFKKGMRVVGASLGSLIFNSDRSPVSFNGGSTSYKIEGNSFNIGVTPSMGWFVSDRMLVGTSLNVQMSNQVKYNKSNAGNTFQKDKSSTYSIGVGGFLRYYVQQKTAGNTRLFGQVGLTLGTGGGKGDGFSFGEDISGAYKVTYENKVTNPLYQTVGLSLGLTHMVNDHVGIDFSVGYAFTNNKNEYVNITNYDYTPPAVADVRLESKPTYKIRNHGISVGVGFQIFLSPRKYNPKDPKNK
jgi:hypothetical protein